jgi:hypothetical protein
VICREPAAVKVTLSSRPPSADPATADTWFCHPHNLGFRSGGIRLGWCAIGRHLGELHYYCGLHNCTFAS